MHILYYMYSLQLEHRVYKKYIYKTIAQTMFLWFMQYVNVHINLYIYISLPFAVCDGSAYNFFVVFFSQHNIFWGPFFSLILRQLCSVLDDTNNLFWDIL